MQNNTVGELGQPRWNANYAGSVMCYYGHLVQEQFATRKITTSINMTVVHCNMIYDTVNSCHNKHQLLHNTTSINCKRSYDTDKYRSHRSQQVSVETDATFICNKYLYQTGDYLSKQMQHLCSASIHARQTGISRNKYRSQHNSTYTHHEYPYKADLQHSQYMHNKNVSLQFTTNMI